MPAPEYGTHYFPYLVLPDDSRAQASIVVHHLGEGFTLGGSSESGVLSDSQRPAC